MIYDVLQAFISFPSDYFPAILERPHPRNEGASALAFKFRESNAFLWDQEHKFIRVAAALARCPAMLSVSRARPCRPPHPPNIFATRVVERRNRERRVGENIKTRINCRVSRQPSEDYDECQRICSCTRSTSADRETRQNETET